MTSLKTMRFAFYTALGLILYFRMMVVFELEEMHELRLFNFIILSIGVWALHRKMFLLKHQYTYLEGLLQGIKMSAFAIFYFMLFLAFYGYVIDPHFIEVMESTNIWGPHLTPFYIGVAVSMEGLASSVIISYISMQYFKPYSVENGLNIPH